MKILLTFSENYAPHAATLMEELLDHASVPLSFAVMYVGLSGEVIGKLTDHFATRVASLEFHRVAPELTEKLTNRRGGWDLPVEVYLRLFAPLYLKQDEVVVYMDIDIVCRGDIAPLLDELVDPRALYAVKIYDENYKTFDPRSYRSQKTPFGDWRATERFYRQVFAHLGMSPPVRYFGAGVLVIDLEKWRQERITERALDYLASMDFLYFHDQDTLNHVIDGHFGELHPRWNVHIGQFGAMQGYSPEQLREAKKHPVLQHFIGQKPWTWARVLRLDGAHRYWKYRRRTPWPARHPSEPLRNVLRDLYWHYFKRHWKRSR